MTSSSNLPPSAAVLIPARNHAELTEVCLRSVALHTELPHRTILIDAGSDPSEAARLRKAAMRWGAQYHREEAPCNYSQANNQGARLAGDAPFLVLLNNDTEVLPGWLSSLVGVAEGISNLGALGNRHLFPDNGLLHHCGIGFDDQGVPIHLHPHAPADWPGAAFQRDVPAVTFACVLIPRAVWLDLGGLEEDFQNGSEDVDFCLRATSRGYRIVYTPASTIYHHGQSTPGRTSFDVSNLQLLQQRHPNRPAGSLRQLEQEGAAWAANRGKRFRSGLPVREGPAIHFAVDFSTGNAFCWAAAELAVAVQKAGMRVSIPRQALDPNLKPSHRAALSRMQRRAPGTDVQLKFSHYWPSSLTQPLCGDVNVELFCSNFFWDGGRHLDLWAQNLRLNGYRKAPVSSFNDEVLGRLGIPSVDRRMVPLGYAPEIETVFPSGLPPRRSDGPFRLFVITNSADLNRYGTDLLPDALEAAFAPTDDVQLHIRDYGAWSGQSPLQEAWASRALPPVTWHNRFLPKEDFLRLHQEMDLLVAPFRGEGFGMKILDAMALGLPVLMPICAGPADFVDGGGVLPLRHCEATMGDCYDRRAYPIGEGATWFEPDPGHLIEQLRWARDHRPELPALGRQALSFVRSSFSWAQAADRLLQAVTFWQQQRAVAVTPRRRPSGPGLTVVIPTHRRTDLLERTLAGYDAQEGVEQPFDIVVVNDGGPPEEAETLAASFRPKLDIEVLHHEVSRGPGAARNTALSKPRRELVLITGDDVIPTSMFLSEHFRAHARYPREQQAVVGYTSWHPDVPQDWFTDILTGPGGAQFDYGSLQDQARVPFDRFYTSNVSCKWSLLVEEQPLFSPCYPLAAYEDTELGYRLALRGMELYYWQQAEGAHLHPYTVETFLQRQVRTGRMLTVLACQRPAYVPAEHRSFLHFLEQLRAETRRLNAPGMDLDPYVLLQAVTSWLKELGDVDPHSAFAEMTVDPPIFRNALAEWFHHGRQQTWQAVNELAVRIGMAEQWAGEGPWRQWALAWTTCAVLPRLFGRSDLYPPDRFTTMSTADVLFPNSRLAYAISLRLREAPGVGEAIRRLEASRPAMVFRRWLLNRLRT